MSRSGRLGAAAAALAAALLVEPAARAGPAGREEPAFRRLTLAAGAVRCLASADLGEQDALPTRRRGGRRDADLVAGADDPRGAVAVWLNRWDNLRLFTRDRSYARGAPAAVRCLAARGAAEGGAAEVVAGTAASPAGNLFVWRGPHATEPGILPIAVTQSCTTADRGDVRAVAAVTLPGGARGLLVGTASPGGRGTLELWGAAHDGPYRRLDVLPDPASGETLAAVSALAAGRAPGPPALVAGTGHAGGGELIVLAIESAPAGPRLRRLAAVATGAVAAVAIADHDLDGVADVAAAIQVGRAGTLELWRGAPTAPGAARLERAGSVPLEGPPAALASGDFGGSPHPDLVVGIADSSGQRGGVRLFLLEGGRLAGGGIDPSSGTVSGAVHGIAVGDFDRGALPRPAWAGRDDIALAVRGPHSGSLALLVR